MTFVSTVYQSSQAVAPNPETGRHLWYGRKIVRIAAAVGSVALIAGLFTCLLFIPGAPLAHIRSSLLSATLLKMHLSKAVSILIYSVGLVVIPAGISFLIAKKIMQPKGLASAFDEALAKGGDKAYDMMYKFIVRALRENNFSCEEPIFLRTFKLCFCDGSYRTVCLNFKRMQELSKQMANDDVNNGGMLREEPDFLQQIYKEGIGVNQVAFVILKNQFEEAFEEHSPDLIALLPLFYVLADFGNQNDAIINKVLTEYPKKFLKLEDSRKKYLRDFSLNLLRSDIDKIPDEIEAIRKELNDIVD